MTKLLNRFRRWLIKKLGGYPAEDHRPQISTLQIKTVFVEAIVPVEILKYPDEKWTVEERTKRDLAYKIGLLLMKDNLISFTLEERAPLNSKIIRAKIYVLEQDKKMELQI